MSQTARYGIDNSLKDVGWDTAENVLYSCFKVLQCARFCLVGLQLGLHLLLGVTPQIKVTWGEIWTSWGPFIRSASSQPTSWKMLVSPCTHSQSKIGRCTILPEYQAANVIPGRHPGPHVGVGLVVGLQDKISHTGGLGDKNTRRSQRFPCRRPSENCRFHTSPFETTC